jgi:energy-converting hydrogenase Eha subunit E
MQYLEPVPIGSFRSQMGQPPETRCGVNKQIAVAAVALVALVLLAAGPALADNPPQVRSLQGQVVDNNDAPIGGAVVYLKNTKTLAVKTFIAGKDGTYRFNALSPSVDYEVYAEADGKKSDTKTLSSFDTQKQARINLKIK